MVYLMGRFKVSITPRAVTKEPIAITMDIITIVLYLPNQLSEMIAPVIGKKYNKNSYV